MPSGVYERTPEIRTEQSAAKMGQKNPNFIHGHSRRGQMTPTYISWKCMLRRSSNPSHRSYKNYGERGIRVYKWWLKFENFLKDMGERPKGLTLERIDNDNNYELGNCRWATYQEQAENRRPQGKLAVSDVLIIRSSRGKVLQRELAQRFKVSQAIISSVQLRESWKNI